MKIITIAAGLSGLIGITSVSAFDNYEEAFKLAQSRYDQGHYIRSAEFSHTASEMTKNSKQKYNALMLEGEALRAGRDFVKAIKVFTQAEKVSGITTSSKNIAYCAKLRALYLGKQYNLLMNTCTETLKSNPASKQRIRFSSFYGCLAAKGMGDFAKEQTMAKKLFQDEPDGSPWKVRGLLFRLQALCNLKKYDEAIDVINAAQMQKIPLPMLAEWNVICGFCEEKAGDPNKALKFYEKAQKYDQGYYQGLAFLRAGIIASQKQATQQLAVTDFKKVLKSGAHPQHKIQAVYRCGELLGKQKKYKEALVFLRNEESIKCNSRWRAEIFRLEGTIYHQQGKLAKAEYFLLASLEQPGCPLKCKLAATGLLNKIKRERKDIENRKTISENSAKS
ncbi:MAG: hypothetical protein GY750_10435 [Lentisphaerae bacterium]|nr:hypothetical protein [Lentisphaerota bacterium]MCP4101828.1 hypothetical protein [Lentisphaerota bacterium]